MSSSGRGGYVPARGRGGGMPARGRGGGMPTRGRGDDMPARGRGGFRRDEMRPTSRTGSQPRADVGTREIDIVANFVPITPMGDKVISMYRIDFNPEVEDGRLQNRLFNLSSRELFTRRPIYDGVHECRSFLKLKDKVNTSKILLDGISYEVKFTYTGNSKLGPEFTRIYNMHMKDFLKKMNYYCPQPGLYVNPVHAEQINNDIMILRGFRTSANLHAGMKVLMNLEGAHKLMQRKNVLEIIEDLMRDKSASDAKAVLKGALENKIAVTSYHENTCYRITGVDTDTKVTDTFDCRGVPTTFRDFYRSKYNIEIRDLKQPLLTAVLNRSKKDKDKDKDNEPIKLLVPELCNLAGLTKQQRDNIYLKRDLIKASQVSPENRVRHLREFLERFHANPQIGQQLTEWGYSYGREPCSMKARVIAPTGYAFGQICQKKPEQYNKARDDTANIMVHGLAKVPVISKMVVIVPKRLQADKEKMLQLLDEGYSKIGMIPQRIESIDIAQDSAGFYVNQLRQLTPDTTVAVVIMKNQNKVLYDAIKKAASVDMGLITQVVTHKLLMDNNVRKAESAAQKIAIQIAAKVGGEPWWVDIPLGSTMVCGYDAHHDTAGSGKSYGAFVASLNMNFSRWWSKSDAHDRLQEISSQMSVNLMEAIKQYKVFNNNQVPKSVIIYRDGVGDGQIDHVKRVELDEIQKVLKTLDVSIKLTMIIVNKRIGARFFMRDRDSFSNPYPGTVVDHTVTRDGRTDFYLVSQSTLNGTVTPTYYHIIHDESGLTLEQHQMLAFKLCLLYYNWSGTVRVPAPCQYAHKLAFLCGEHLHRQPHSIMDSKLHFL